MLFLLQIFLTLYLVVLIIRAIDDAIRGTVLILTGLTLIAVGYMVKLVLALIRACRRHRRQPQAWKVLHP